MNLRDEIEYVLSENIFETGNKVDSILSLLIKRVEELEKIKCANKEHDDRWCAYCEARNDGMDLVINMLSEKG